ncbi:hypothetical protein [Massilia endophytica]|uniref:hypothetical protein n=1 Tax=Massilia endophytica TaxID=2899220 RepID=UPI001E5BA86C|nr:hypothetical protein [Massilia endophytica]UGQ44747.1 hypothetical protein LSQ66_13135 [Massilia endophytica]
MARDIYAYRDVAVESFQDGAQVRVRPVNGQAYHSGLRVQCSRELTDTSKYPVGTCFRVLAKLTDRLGGMPYLYVYHGDPVVVLSPQQCERFLAEFRRGRI